MMRAEAQTHSTKSGHVWGPSGCWAFSSGSLAAISSPRTQQRPRSAKTGGAATNGAEVGLPLDAVDASAPVVDLGHHTKAKPLLERPGQRAADRVRLPAERLGDFGDGSALCPTQHGDELRLLGAFARPTRGLAG